MLNNYSTLQHMLLKELLSRGVYSNIVTLVKKNLITSFMSQRLFVTRLQYFDFVSFHRILMVLGFFCPKELKFCWTFLRSQNNDSWHEYSLGLTNRNWFWHYTCKYDWVGFHLLVIALWFSMESNSDDINIIIYSFVGLKTILTTVSILHQFHISWSFHLPW